MRYVAEVTAANDGQVEARTITSALINSSGRRIPMSARATKWSRGLPKLRECLSTKGAVRADSIHVLCASGIGHNPVMLAGPRDHLNPARRRKGAHGTAGAIDQLRMQSLPGRTRAAADPAAPHRVTGPSVRRRCDGAPPGVQDDKSDRWTQAAGPSRAGDRRSSAARLADSCLHARPSHKRIAMSVGHKRCIDRPPERHLAGIDILAGLIRSRAKPGGCHFHTTKRRRPGFVRRPHANAAASLRLRWG